MRYKQYYSIQDLNRSPFNEKKGLNYGSIKICVIDDDDFAPGFLNNVGFSNIRVRTEFGSIDDYKDYNIILVDVSGVGTRQYNNREGAAVAEELIDAYPDKIVAIYSAMDPDEITRKLNKYKDIDIISKGKKEELIEKLKGYAVDFGVPYYSCLRFEKVIERLYPDSTFLQKAILEHGFVASIIDDANYFKGQEFTKASQGVSLAQNVLSIAASLLTIMNLLRPC